jgi:hypothetical protein
MNGVKVTEVCKMVLMVYIVHTLCNVFRKRRLMQCLQFFLFYVHICHKGKHLSLVTNGVKVTEEAYLWVPAMFQMN